MSGQAQTFDIKVLPVQGFDATMVYMLVGAGGNIVVQIGDEGVVMVDTVVAAASDAVLRTIRTLTDKPIRYVIDAHHHADHVGGNEAIVHVKASGGQRTDAGGGGGAQLQDNQSGVMVLAHQNTVDAMLFPQAGRTPLPEPRRWPGRRSSPATSGCALQRRGHRAVVASKCAHQRRRARLLPRSNVDFGAGDLLQMGAFPMFDVEAGGRLQGLLNGLDQIINLAVPRFNQIGGTRIVPGHGWLCTESDVVEARDMGTIVRARVRYLDSKEHDGGAGPGREAAGRYEPVYGSTTGPWTTERFFEAVYADLKKPWDGPGPVAKSGLDFIDGGK